MEEETKATQVRFPASMYQRLTEGAKKSRRSLNGEIIFCLEEYFQMIDELEASEGRFNTMWAQAMEKALKKVETLTTTLKAQLQVEEQINDIRKGGPSDTKPHPPENPRPPSPEPPQGSA